MQLHARAKVSTKMIFGDFFLFNVLMFASCMSHPFLEAHKQQMLDLTEGLEPKS